MKVAIAALCLAFGLRADDCPPSKLTPQETLARFQELDRAAQASFDAGRYVAAAQQYRDAACVAPNSARALYGLGIAEAAAGNFAEARKALETAYSILPKNAMPLAMLVRVNVAMKDVEQVKAALRTAAQRFPDDAELHSGLARFLAESQMLDLALAESLRLEETGTSDPASAIELAALENTVGAYEDAIRTAAPVEKQASLAAEVRASAAGVAALSLEGAGRREEAIQRLQTAIRLSPSQENSYLALAFLYQKAQRFKEAAALLTEARKRFPSSLDLLLPLGNNLVWAEHHEAGIQVLNELLTKSPGVTEAYIRLAEAYRNMGRSELEVQALRRLARVQPDYPMLHTLIARAMTTMETPDHSAVMAELALAEKSAPNDSEIFYLRGKVYASMGRLPEAVTSLKRAIELSPMDRSAYYQLGLIYGKLEQPELARQTLARMRLLQESSKP
jgi:tetratricopeptide (TPR) repeat protein